MKPFTPAQLERYSRHFVLSEIGVSGQKRLLTSKVLVIGAGALGSAALLYLAAAGVGTIGIADYDAVELSNLQRQVIHRTQSVGKSKLESARETIATMNPDVSVVLHEHRIDVDNIGPILQNYDFIVDATDRLETKFLINDACVLYQKPYAHAGIIRFHGQAMTYVPGKGPCLRCLLGAVPPAQEGETCAQVGVVGAATGVLGSIQALEAIKYLTGTGDLLTGRIFMFDGLTMHVHVINAAQPSPDCGVCGTHPAITNLQDNRREYEVSAASPAEGDK